VTPAEHPIRHKECVTSGRCDIISYTVSIMAK